MQGQVQATNLGEKHVTSRRPALTHAHDCSGRAGHVTARPQPWYGACFALVAGKSTVREREHALAGPPGDVCIRQLA